MCSNKVLQTNTVLLDTLPAGTTTIFVIEISKHSSEIKNVQDQFTSGWQGRAEDRTQRRYRYDPVCVLTSIAPCLALRQ